MSVSKAQLVETASTKYGIKNAAELPYRQLENTIRELKQQARITVETSKSKTPKKVVKAKKESTRPYIVEIRKGLVRYYYVVKAPNGEITSVSQKYFSESNARRSAVVTANKLNGVLRHR
jgi:predicted ATP-dependent serine protease